MAQPYHDEETLEKLYVKQGLDQTEIAERFGVTQTTISKWLRKTGVRSTDSPWQDKETLRDLYHEQGLKQQEIADKFGIAGNTVSQWMSKHGITTRPHQDAPHKNETVLRYLYNEERLSLLELERRFGVSKNTIRYWMDKHGIERRDTHCKQYEIPRDKLERLYIDEKQSAKECAEHFDCSPRAISIRLQEYGIERRNNSQVQRAWRGESVPLRLNPLGYQRWHDQIAGKEVFVHQLTAIADGADPEHVFGGNHVHHKNTVRWDNRPSNLELLQEDTHMATHQNGEWTDRDGYPELKTTQPIGAI